MKYKSLWENDTSSCILSGGETVPDGTKIGSWLGQIGIEKLSKMAVVRLSCSMSLPM